MADNHIVIAIDGPAASGKSTTAKSVAEKLGFLYIDTGAMYRAITYYLIENAINLSDKKLILKHANSQEIEQKNINSSTKTFLNGIDVSNEIRSREVTLNISSVASIPELRELLVEQQRYMSIGKNVVLDGRDIGTVVFPDADLKIFMVASVEERAKRRFEEFQNKGENISLEQVIKEIKARDLEDEMRSSGALKRAADAILIDTSKMEISDQVDQIISILKSKNIYSA